MQNEFYEIIIDNGDFLAGPRFFRSKDKAFTYFWQEYLNACGDRTEEELEDAKFELFNWYSIEGFGEVAVRSFDD